jgi:peptide/nickel transport system substrate-binding protein
MNYWKTASAQRLSRRRALAGAGAGTLAGVLLAACGGDDGSGSTDTGSLVTRPVDTSKQAKRGGVMQFYRDREVTTSDPHFTSRTQPGTASTYSRLFRRKPGHLGPQPVEFIGDLSESWEVSPDKLQITIKLKPATWHNVAPVSGRPVDGQDIAYSWQRVASVGANRSLLANAASPSAPIESIRAIDNRTIQIKTSQPAAGLFGLLSGTISGYLWIIPRESEDKYDLRRTTIGSGQWMVGEYEPSVRLVFKRHEGWHEKDSVYFDEVREPIVPEYATGLAQFKTGSIYSFAVRPTDILATKKDVPSLELYALEPPSNGNIAFFGWNPAYGAGTPFRDKRLRQALSMSWDRDLWIDTFYEYSKFRSEGIPAEVNWNSSLLAVWPEWWLDPKGKELGAGAKYYQYDLAEAKKLVAAAGFASGVDIKAQYIITGEYGTDFNGRVETLMNFARAAGLNMRTVPVNFNTDWRPKVADALGDFEGISFRAGAAGTQIADVIEGAFAYYHYQGGVNYTGFFSANSSFQKGDPRLNEILEKGRAEFDPKKRISLAHELQRLMAEEQYMLHFPGSASTFDLSWPAVRNQNVFTGELAHVRTWLDTSRRPVGSS